MIKRGVDVGLFHQAQAWLKIRLFSQHVCSFEVTILHIGDWSNGMIGVSKTFGGSSILSSPVLSESGSLLIKAFRLFAFHPKYRIQERRRGLQIVTFYCFLLK